eukprot:1834136-Pyramimonas_sp.AAC.1
MKSGGSRNLSDLALGCEHFAYQRAPLEGWPSLADDGTAQTKRRATHLRQHPSCEGVGKQRQEAGNRQDK